MENLASSTCNIALYIVDLYYDVKFWTETALKMSTIF